MGHHAAQGRAALRTAGAVSQARASAGDGLGCHLLQRQAAQPGVEFGANTGEVLQEVLRIAIAEGPAVIFLDEAEALSLEHLLPPPQAREASARLVASLCERLDGVSSKARVLVVAATSRTDAVDPALVAPGRLDHLVEVPLPDADEQKDTSRS